MKNLPSVYFIQFIVNNALGLCLNINMYVMAFILETIKINFGRLPEWNCPIPDTDAKPAEVHNEVTTVQSTSDITTSQSSAKEVNTIFAKIPLQQTFTENIFSFFFLR